MPRRTYRHRLQDLIANPAINGRDQLFAQSLLSYYERKGSLTSGRAAWVRTLEERYSPENIAANAAKGADMLERLNAVCERTEESSWARGFINSLQGQIMGGRELSEKQITTLASIEEDHNDEAMSARAVFAADYRSDRDGMRSDALAVAHYYRAAGYFNKLAQNIIENPAYVPTHAEYSKMTKNKYAQKVLREHHAPAKYPVGSYVLPRAGNYGLKHRTGGKPCIVVETDAAPITSAAKGSKMYKLLPIGRAETILAEERTIMKARRIK